MSNEYNGAGFYTALGICGFLASVFIAAIGYSCSAIASSVPVGVTVHAENCPVGTVLVVNDVETGLFVDDRGKLTTTIQGLAGYNITVQMHSIPEQKDFETITTPASMSLRINLDCQGTSFVSRRGL